MKPKDKEIIDDVRRLCRHTQNVYAYLAAHTQDQKARNVFKRLANHRIEIARAIAMESSGFSEQMVASQTSASQEKGSAIKLDYSVNNGLDSRFLQDLIANEKREVSQMRSDVRQIANYALRCRLSSVVATLQMDFDQLKSLTMDQKTSPNGDDYEKS